MKRTTLITTFLMIAMLVLFGISMTESKAQKSPYKFKSKKINIFNGKNLDNWNFYLRKSNEDPANIFTVKDGKIHMNPFPWGYMSTKDSYSDYKLHLEWRWPEEATNSGVFVHYQPRDDNSFKWIEVNLVAGGAGNFILERGIEMDEKNEKTKNRIPKLADSSEKSVGEWNTMEIICVNNSIVVYVNGVLQNKGTNMNVSGGKICLQCEGKDIEFRNVYLNELKK